MGGAADTSPNLLVSGEYMKKGSHLPEEVKQKIRDSIAARGGSWCKGMTFAKKTHCIRGHEYTAESTSFSNGKRSCAICIKQWHVDHPNETKEASRLHSWNRRLKTLYHLTQEQYDRMHVEQKGLCILPSCGKRIEATDHCHETHKTRGLMCHKHNLAIGLFSNSPTLLREAAEYLERFNEQQQQLHGTVAR
jgi:hypothetical protein